MLPDILGRLKMAFRRELGTDHFKMGRSCRVLVVTGENAGGKSFIRKFFQECLRDRKHPIKTYSYSMQSRARSAADGMMMALAHGSESEFATSANTVSAIRRIFETSSKDIGEERHVIIIDEPEIGLSEETELAIGQMMAKRLSSKWPKKLAGVVVMTHSKHIVEEMMMVTGTKFLNLFDRYPTAKAWIEREIVPTDLERFEQESFEKFRRLSQMLKPKKEAIKC